VTATPRAVELIEIAAMAAADKLATDIIAYDVSEQLVISDAFLLCSAANDRQVKAVVDEIELKLSQAGAKPVLREGEREGRWVLLDFADERSVVSSRFITSSIVLLRAQLGTDVRSLPAEAEREVARPLPPELAERAEFTFLGCGWAAPVADEAALKLREASRTWAESYPAMEYRHGPISVSDENTVVWALGEVPSDLLADARRTGATVIASDTDPLAALIGAQRLAADLAERKGIDPDQPRALSRSVILTG